MHGRAVIAARSGAVIGPRPSKRTAAAAAAAAAARRRRPPPRGVLLAAAATGAASAAAPHSSEDRGGRFHDDDDDDEDAEEDEMEQRARSADNGSADKQQEDEDEQWARERQCRARVSLAASTGRLDLSSLGLRGAPPVELWDLGSDLADLSLAGNALTTLEGLGELSGLRRLAVAGNALHSFPRAAELRRLTELEGLWAHGNLLRALPGAMFGGAAVAEEEREEESAAAAGPEDGDEPAAAPAKADAAAFPRLRSLSLAGNRLSAIPALAPGALPALAELAAGGNRLRALPEGLARGAPALETLAAHGNALAGAVRGAGETTTPPPMLPPAKLRRLSLQGNRLRGAALGGDWSGYAALEHVNVADNGPGLTRLLLDGGDDDDNSGGGDGERGEGVPPRPRLPPRLRSLTAYGNGLRSLPLAALASCRELSYLWLEGNPLSRETVEGLLRLAPEMPSLRALGLDEAQLRGVSEALVRGAGPALRVGAIVGGGAGDDDGASSPPSSSSPSSWGPGYFKLMRGPAPPPGQPSVLVVAYGSAPGEPNWAGALKRARAEAAAKAAAAAAQEAAAAAGQAGAADGEAAAAAAAAAASAFDVLYVVDPHRDWYWMPEEWRGKGRQGGKESGGSSSSGSGSAPPASPSSCSSSSSSSSYYAARVRRAAAPYDRVLLLGDSMGASAALMASGCATSVLAFCPQVDLGLSAIRPGRPPGQLARWRRTLLAAVAAAPPGTRVRVLTGTWQHDVDQAKALADALAEEAGGRKEAEAGELGGGNAPAAPAGPAAPSPAPTAGPELSHEAFPVDSHRLAAALAKAGRLTPILREAIAREQGLLAAAGPGGGGGGGDKRNDRGGGAGRRAGVRLANLL